MAPGKRWMAAVAALVVFLAGAAARAETPGPVYPPGEAPIVTEPEAIEKAWSLDFDLTYNSKYVWRGIKVVEDPVYQPSIGFTYEGLTLNVWANIDATDVNDYRNQASEIDYTLEYAFDWECLTFAVGGIFYSFPQAHVLDTTEVYGSVGVNVLTSPTLTVYQDLDEHDGTYMVLSFGHAFEDVWSPCEDVSLSVELGTSFAYGTHKHNAFYYGLDAGGWADATLSLATPIAIGENLTVTPAVNWSWILSDKISAALSEDHIFWAGVSVALSF